jgi:hypothetical protein
MVPAFDKASVVSFSALFACLIFAPVRRNGQAHFGAIELLLLIYVVGPFITSQLNGDNLLFGTRFLPGVGMYDGFSAAEGAAIFLIPFFLARRFLGADEDFRDLLKILAISGAVYSLLLLFEVRFSPQLHFWVYGYYPSDFVQTLRESGFRPMAFMGHGLLAALFLMASLLATVALWRTQAPRDPPWLAIAMYIGIVLLLCKSLGALIYGVLASALIAFARPRRLVIVACVLAAISLGYPMLRAFDLVPTAAVVELARSFDTVRAGSLQYRLDNEDRLLERAFERPVFGWGRFGRSRVYDAETGKDITVTDGRWIIDLGQFGFVGFLAEFGLLALCIFRSARACRFAKPRTQMEVAALTLFLSINVFDLLPNSGLLPLTWLIAGALLSFSERAEYQRTTSRAFSQAPAGHRASLDA